MDRRGTLDRTRHQPYAGGARRHRRPQGRYRAPAIPLNEQLVVHDGDSYGFPSGHATAAVVVYGGVVFATDRFRTHLMALVAGVVVLLVVLSQVILGVHYLGDVLAGLVVGSALLGGTWVLARGHPRRGFAVAVVASLPALAVAGLTAETVVAFVVALQLLGDTVAGVMGGLVVLVAGILLLPLATNWQWDALSPSKRVS